ncbi:hypothetical protein PWT90_03844 [Aphanocladium album]|nr:hypothetical protein PWT90_03844 [Aphanocladium album]
MADAVQRTSSTWSASRRHANAPFPPWRAEDLGIEFVLALATKTTCDLPSWSWIGWQGRTWMYRDTLRIDALEIRTQETFPITEWSCGKSPRDPPSMRRVIRHSWYEQREKWKDLANPIPPGWTRYEVSTIPEFMDKTLLHPESCGKYAFKHAALSDSDNGSSYWWYPFPVPTIDESTPCVIPEQWPYLFCRTESVRAWTCQGEKTETEEGTILLHDASGAQSGSLLVHNEESFAEFPSSLPGREIELVALHRANFYSKTYDKETKTHGEPINETKGAMCVLWAEWENGVAFRRGCGHVNPGAWPTLNPKEIDLVLG